VESGWTKFPILKSQCLTLQINKVRSWDALTRSALSQYLHTICDPNCGSIWLFYGGLQSLALCLCRFWTPIIKIRFPMTSTHLHTWYVFDSLRTLCHLIDFCWLKICIRFRFFFFFFNLSVFQFSFGRFSPQLEMRFQNVIGQCARWIPLAISFARHLPLSFACSFNMFIRSSLWLAWLLCG